MSNRKDICVPRAKKDGGTYWVKIGTAWENNGKTQLVFDALPIPDGEGRVVANLFEPKEPSGNGRSAGAAGGSYASNRQAGSPSFAGAADEEDAPF